VLISLVLDFHCADVGVREAFHRSDDEVEGLYARRSGVGGVREFLVLNTCNRIELYGWLEATPRTLRTPHLQLALRYFGDTEEARRFVEAATARTGRSVVEHLFRVTSGLESQILGDIHIQGQIRRSYRIATEAGMVGPHLHRLFDTALKTGKAVKRETDLMAGRSSVGSEAAQLADRRLGGLRGKRCLIVGCGKIGTHAAQSLIKLGAEVRLLNRSPQRAETLARTTGGAIGDWSQLHAEVARADAVIVATGARTPVIRLEPLLAERTSTDGPLMIVDVAMPRNVEPGIAGFPDVTLIDLDQLHPEAASVARARQAAVPMAESLVADHADEYLAWQASQGARDALRPLREALEEICLREISFAAGQGAESDARRAAGRIVSKLLARPMTVLRGRQRDEDVEVVGGAMRLIFSEEAGLEARPS
jgi:glutamyl-tRNA reductase